MIIKAMRLTLLITILIASISTILFITIPLLTSSFFASILLVVLVVLGSVVLREIYRIMTWKGY